MRFFHSCLSALLNFIMTLCVFTDGCRWIVIFKKQQQKLIISEVTFGNLIVK